MLVFQLIFDLDKIQKKSKVKPNVHIQIPLF